MNAYRYAWLDLLNSVPNHCTLAHHQNCEFVELHQTPWDFTKEYQCGYELGRTRDGDWVTVIGF